MSSAGVASLVIIFAAAAAALELSTADRYLCKLLLRNFSFIFAVANSLVLIVIASIATLPEFSSPLTIVGHMSAWLVLLGSSLFIDAMPEAAVSRRMRLMRVACACFTWLRLLATQRIWPQLDTAPHVCLVYCANLEFMAHGTQHNTTS